MAKPRRGKAVEPTGHTAAGVELSQITKDEWRHIRELAVAIHSSGQSDKCMFKASVMAFVQWMVETEEAVMVPDPSDGQVH